MVLTSLMKRRNEGTGNEGGPSSCLTAYDKGPQRNVGARSCIEVVLTVDPQARLDFASSSEEGTTSHCISVKECSTRFPPTQQGLTHLVTNPGV
jgi:hypothetical protein